jgi:peptidoglycan L-alanyl-D-glutamate endopeptidase CwlK
MDRLLTAKINGVDHRLILVMQHAELRLPFNLRIIEGLRSKARQSSLVAAGASLISNSRHLDGRAIDVAPVICGQVSWDWHYFYQIAAAVHIETAKMGLKLVWGGVWDRLLTDLKADDLDGEVAAYVARRKKIRPGRRVLTDGPHFELSPKHYPKAIPYLNNTTSLIVGPESRPAKTVTATRPATKTAV